MEVVNQLENLNILENKVKRLLDLYKSKDEQIAKLQADCNILLAEKTELAASLEKLETSVLKGCENKEELNQERLLTKSIVDELINSIDKIVENPL